MMLPGADWDPTVRVPWECGSILEEIRGMNRVAICCKKNVWICEISKIVNSQNVESIDVDRWFLSQNPCFSVFPYSGVTHSNMRHVFDFVWSWDGRIWRGTKSCETETNRALPDVDKDAEMNGTRGRSMVAEVKTKDTISFPLAYLPG